MKGLAQAGIVIFRIIFYMQYIACCHVFLLKCIAVEIIALCCTSLFFLGSLTIDDDRARRAGLMSELSVQCSTCHESTSLPTSTSVTRQGTSYDINRQVVYHAIETGGGCGGLAAFCSIVNTPISGTSGW